MGLLAISNGEVLRYDWAVCQIREQLNHIRYLPSFASRSFPTKKPCATWVKKNILALKDRPEELYWQRKQHELNKLEYRRLKQHYAYCIFWMASPTSLSNRMSLELVFNTAVSELRMAIYLVRSNVEDIAMISGALAIQLR
ncbi:uncharacterized protein VTP21DRAFT_9052 [Calcarisporiella thermophila]|uniref:uncharacterized protein n=1 Tax=Calcarisporiella thermophila TaxID=911321 RepID=UPI00374220A5